METSAVIPQTSTALALSFIRCSCQSIPKWNYSLFPRHWPLRLYVKLSIDAARLHLVCAQKLGGLYLFLVCIDFFKIVYYFYLLFISFFLDMQTKLDWVTFKQQKKKRVVRRYEMHKKSQADGGFMALQSKAFEGSTSELFVLARMYSTGDGVRQDKQKAIELYQIAADLGHSTAQFNLAVKYATGDGVEKDEKRAAQLYQLAADKGDPVAQYNLALKYAEGKGVEKNDRKALSLYQLAALQGDPEAQYNLARRYRAGRAIIEDHAKAESWYEMAADGGNRKAQRHVYRRIKPATSAHVKQV